MSSPLVVDMKITDMLLIGFVLPVNGNRKHCLAIRAFNSALIPSSAEMGSNVTVFRLLFSSNE